MWNGFRVQRGTPELLIRTALTMGLIRTVQRVSLKLSAGVKIAALVRRKPGVLRPGFVGMRGQWSYDYGMQDYEYTPPLTSPFGLSPLTPPCNGSGDIKKALIYVIDTPRTSNPTTFMSNMLYACSVLYKSRLPLVLALNKV